MPKISHSLRNRFSLLAMCLFFAFNGLSSRISPTTHQMQLPLAGDRKGLLPVGRRQPAFWIWTHILLSNRWDPTFHLWIKNFTSMTIKVLATCKHSSSDHHGSDLLQNKKRSQNPGRQHFENEWPLHLLSRRSPCATKWLGAWERISFAKLVIFWNTNFQYTALEHWVIRG